VIGFFAGTFVNRLGVKITLSFGGLGYCIYAISLLASEHADVGGFNIFAGALLGVCAALLWTAQGTIMLSYPFEAQKGKYFAWFWTIFNLGGVIGSLVSSKVYSSFPMERVQM
jgi:MFS family permease